MFFPDASLEAWLKRYPELTIEEGVCDGCGKMTKTTRPFIEKKFVGLVTPKCECGEAKHKTMVGIPISAEKIEFWRSTLNNV